MSRAALPASLDFTALRFGWRGRCSAEARVGMLSVVAAAALLAGCASTPPGSSRSEGAGRPTSSAPGRSGGPALPSGSIDRDGAPSDAPPDLASLADPVPKVEPIKPGGPNKPYVVLGQAYEPVANDVSWKERGLASWYGTKFHGRRTASGEMFSMYGLTAAHRTLPIPSYARVRNLSTGKEIIVRVNDRGPFHSARVMDLSYAAAVKLGIVNLGSAQVEIERLTFDEIRTGAWKRGTVLDTDEAQAATVPLSPSSDAGTSQDDPILAQAQAKLASPPSTSDEAVFGQAQSASSGRASDINASPVAVSTAVPLSSPIKEGQSRAYTPFAKGFWVQLAALGRREGVDKLQQRVASELSSLTPLVAVFHEAAFFKLQIGPFGSRHEAMAVAQQAKDALQLVPMVVERR